MTEQRLKIIEGYHVKRGIVDRAVFIKDKLVKPWSTNMEVKFKMRRSNNAVTKNSYKNILIHRAISAIGYQKYFGVRGRL